MMFAAETTNAKNRDAGRRGVSESSPQEIDGEELSRRIAVVKRFRALLQEQRDHFHSYLEVLDRQKDVIEKGNAESLLNHVELEEKIVADIFSIQKVIDPLEEMYQAAVSGYNRAETFHAQENTGVPALKAALESLKTEAAVRSRENRELLSRRMEEIRDEIKILRGNPYLQKRPVYGSIDTASLIDITG
jgi:type I site-specific restriction-modification system R (restriction) subunit